MISRVVKMFRQKKNRQLINGMILPTQDDDWVNWLDHRSNKRQKEQHQFGVCAFLINWKKFANLNDTNNWTVLNIVEIPWRSTDARPRAIPINYDESVTNEWSISIFSCFFLRLFIDNHRRHQNRNGNQCVSVSWNVNQTYKTLHAQSLLTPTRVRASHTNRRTHAHRCIAHRVRVCVRLTYFECVYFIDTNKTFATRPNSTNAVVGLVFDRIFANFHNFKINEERNAAKKKKKRRREKDRERRNKKKRHTREELIVVSLSSKLDWLCVCISFTSAR